jgi:Glycogen recognition site of AMP-activated protein kinase
MDARRCRSPRRGLALLAAAMLLPAASGCGSMGFLDFVKRRLPPPSPVPGGIRFQFASPSARVVQVAGSWPENDWLRGQGENATYDLGRMDDSDGDGVWSIVVDLPPGRYQYKFRIDETNWKEDPNNPQKVDDGFGGFNSLLIVK